MLLLILPRQLYPKHPVLAAWSAMPGLVLLIHFGALHLIALAFQARGINAVPLMKSPAGADSLADFWGRRWNTGFASLSRDFVFRPLVPILGATGATAIAFLASGIVHDLVISLPARGGYGRPTLYFLIQLLGLLAQRTRPARRLGLARGTRGWIFTAAFTLAPLPLLLHGPFIRNVILPFLHALGVLEPSASFFHRKELLMPALSTLLLIGGVLHLGITSAGIVMTLVLDWRKKLAPLAALTRHIIWTHAAFVLLTILGFASISLLAAPSLASGTPLARAVCAFIALFWAIRLMIQFFLFDARPFLTRPILAVGYHGLTVVFIYFVAVYGLAAVSPIR
jgi:alginate O-acetyltransferase complex protein AlgI